MGNFLVGTGARIMLLDTAADEMKGRIFGLDPQLIVDALIVAVSVFALFMLLSYLLFNPARDLLKKRQDKIRDEMEFAEREKQDAIQFKAEYDGKLKAAKGEVEEILSSGRKKSLKREAEIIEEAKVEAARIHDRAEKEIVLEKNKMKDEVKKEMVSVASVMAGKLISGNLDKGKQDKLIAEALNEMGDATWQN